MAFLLPATPGLAKPVVPPSEGIRVEATATRTARLATLEVFHPGNLAWDRLVARSHAVTASPDSDREVRIETVTIARQDVRLSRSADGARASLPLSLPFTVPDEALDFLVVTDITLLDETGTELLAIRGQWAVVSDGTDTVQASELPVALRAMIRRKTPGISELALATRAKQLLEQREALHARIYDRVPPPDP